MKKKLASPIRREWTQVYRIMRSIAKSCRAYNAWYDTNKDLARWAAVEVGIDILRFDSLPHVYANSSCPTSYRVFFRGCKLNIEYDSPLDIKISGAGKNRQQWQEFAQLLEEEKAEADRKRAHLFDIVATVSDDAITHIYNSATVWEAWDKRGR